MWELDHKESWVPKNWCFWILVLERRFLRVPWTARRSNQSILKEISFECSLEGLVLKLKLQSFGHLMWWTDSLEKTLMLGKIEGRRRWGWQRLFISLFSFVVHAKSLQFQSCTTLCDPMDCGTTVLPVLHYLLEFSQTHVHCVNDAIEPS